MSTTLVSIDDCTSVQVLPAMEVPLAVGTLQLLDASEPAAQSPTTHSSDTSGIILTLKIGNAAFPITKSTPFYTHTSSPRIYIFAPVLDDTAVGAGTYVKLTLPEDIQVSGSEAEVARNMFEEILVERGLLQEGTAAVADEIASSAREAGLKAASSIRRATSLRRHTTDPPAEPSTSSSTTHPIVDSAVSGSAVFQSYASSAGQTMVSVGTSIGATAGSALSKATETVARAGVAIGERLVHMLGMENQVERAAAEENDDNAGWSGGFGVPKDDRELGSPYKSSDGGEELLKGVRQAGVGSEVKDGTDARSATRDGATFVIEHSVSPEALELAETPGEAVNSVRKATGDAVLATSAVLTAGYIDASAQGEPTPNQDAESTGKVKESDLRPAPELLEAQPIHH
ncbi:Senescence-associated protein [Ceratobasidium theobromae]|uniref:Senescence-associated protein n=1 Tax=Ceratobasidium theobromae TaxID=1582974 RepID=A0A5N5QKB8_9AGAM|nr:Senescence-associated protein [Ceratobasidium theobromae]